MARAKKPRDIAVKAAADVSSGGKEAPAAAVASVGKEAPGESGEVVVNEAATVAETAEIVDAIAGEGVEIANGVDAEPARSMADDLRDIAGAFGVAPAIANALPGLVFDTALLALELEAENHPQGRQGCMMFDPPRQLPLAIAGLVDDGVWKRCDFGAMWQFWIEKGGVWKMIRADMIHLREAPENVRELAA